MRPVGLVTFILLFTWTAAAQAAEQCGVAPAMRRTRRIIRGDDVTPHQYPWVVSVQYDGDHFCGGAIISGEYVISAAHCIVDPALREVTVVAGLHDLESGGVRVNGTATVHPGYVAVNLSLVSSDIALIRLDRPLRFDEHIQPICLPDDTARVDLGDEVHIAGWGREYSWREIFLWASSNFTSLSADQLNELVRVFYPKAHTVKKLKQKTFQIGTLEECLIDVGKYMLTQRERCEAGKVSAQWCSMFEKHLNMSLSAATLDQLQKELWQMDKNDRVCTLVRDQEGNRSAACNGDSGSPLMRQHADGTWYLVGIASSTPPDCTTDEQSLLHIGVIFTDVRYHLNWIRATMQREHPATSASSAHVGQPKVTTRSSNSRPDSLTPPKPSFTALLSWDYSPRDADPGINLNLRFSFP